MGNVLVLRSDTDNLAGQLSAYKKDVSLSTLLMDDVILSALKESLRLRFHEELMQRLVLEYKILDEVSLSPHPPELLTLAHLIEKKELSENGERDANNGNDEMGNNNHTLLFVYPNPPINLREEKLLRLCQFTKYIKFLTPTLLPLYEKGMSDSLNKLKVNISISNPSKDELSNIFVRDMLIELAKQLLSLKITLVYGGDLNFIPQNGFNFTETLIEIYLLYTSPSPRDATLSRMPSSA